MEVSDAQPNSRNFHRSLASPIPLEKRHDKHLIGAPATFRQISMKPVTSRILEVRAAEIQLNNLCRTSKPRCKRFEALL
jgi:hypothetical protein